MALMKVDAAPIALRLYSMKTDPVRSQCLRVPESTRVVDKDWRNEKIFHLRNKNMFIMNISINQSTGLSLRELNELKPFPIERYRVIGTVGISLFKRRWIPVDVYSVSRQAKRETKTKRNGRMVASTSR